MKILKKKYFRLNNKKANNKYSIVRPTPTCKSKRIKSLLI